MSLTAPVNNRHHYGDSKIKKATKKKDKNNKFIEDNSHPEEQRIVESSSNLNISSMLFLQEVNQEFLPKREIDEEVKDFTQNALRNLKQLQYSIINGHLSPDLLSDLQNCISKTDFKEVDPVLKNILDEIELRVAVEIAKIENM